MRLQIRVWGKDEDEFNHEIFPYFLLAGPNHKEQKHALFYDGGSYCAPWPLWLNERIIWGMKTMENGLKLETFFCLSESSQLEQKHVFFYLGS